ncbi:MAG: hypothetical protein PHE07_01580 [Bacteroidales bacterium]|nr:hypothetical protein [Bacteroidales bacterium]
MAKVSIKLKTPQRVIDASMRHGAQEVKKRILVLMEVAGTEGMNAARLNGSYMDQTGNCRGSVGYALVEDGKLVKTGEFTQVREGAEGPQSGRQLAEQIASEFPKGITVVLLAGMPYASALSARGYDVIDSGILKTMRLIPELLKPFRN